MSKNFSLIGAAGYIAPRHMKAIKETGNQLTAALDKSDSVGIIDSFFPKAYFFTEFEQFDRHIDKLRRQNHPNKIDYVSICSPNYLHDAHIRFALRSEADAICEKPLVLNPWNLDGIEEIQNSTGKKLNTILQLRLHPALLELKAQLDNTPAPHKHEVDLCYITSRGNWYLNSWKGDTQKSGGIATNIGIHFFDMLIWLFGPASESIVYISEPDRAAGYLELANARVRWFLSTNKQYLPQQAKQDNKATYRSITVGGKEVEFSGGFTDLHTSSYKGILRGEGFGIEDARPSIELAHNIREATPVGLQGDAHPQLLESK
jgi:UDP-N-acetyl-2-amino-2-deoxyglucuronate dehydrogenase